MNRLRVSLLRSAAHVGPGRSLATEVIMATHTPPHALGLDSLRASLHRLASSVAPARVEQPVLPWLERLAAWADRQPPHHHLGSNPRL